MKSRTLTSHLFFRISPVIVVTFAIIGLLAFRSTTDQINHVYDAQLINNAGILWSLTQSEIARGEATFPHKVNFDSDELNANHDFTLNDDADDYEVARMMRIWKDGKIVMYSDTSFPDTVRAAPAGFSTVVYKDEAWRVFSLSIASNGVSIEVGEKMVLRRDLVSDVIIDLFIPLLSMIPIIGILLWWGIGNGLQVIRSIVQQIRDRSPDDLSPIDIGTLPRDLEPLGVSINQLLVKLEDSLTAERRFADHAAHQLRTPLAGLKLQLQMLAATNDEAGRQLSIRNLLASTDRATKLVGQLLSAVRVSHQPLDMKSVPLYPLTAAVVADMGAIITSKNMNVSLSGDEVAAVMADENLLRLAIVNVFENALKYTPAHGKIELNIGTRGETRCLSVQDSGPGIPPEHRKSVFNRFYRIDDPAVEGAGMGLAIVAEIIKRFSGDILLKNNPGGPGLLVEILLPGTAF